MGFGLLNWWLITGSTVVFMDHLDEDLYPKLLSQFKVVYSHTNFHVAAHFQPRYLFVTPPIFAFLTKHPLGVAASMDSVQVKQEQACQDENPSLLSVFTLETLILLQFTSLRKKMK